MSDTQFRNTHLYNMADPDQSRSSVDVQGCPKYLATI